MSTLATNGGCVHCIGDSDSVISSTDKDSFCVQCFQNLFEKRVNVGPAALPAYLKSKPPPVPPKPSKSKDKDNSASSQQSLSSSSSPLPPLSVSPAPPIAQSAVHVVEVPKYQQSQSQPLLPGFVCSSCDTPLQGKTVESRAGRVYCRGCYDDVIQKICCHHCGELIAPGAKQITYEGQPWHSNCFRCSKCNDVIGQGRGFCNADRGIFCEECYFETSGKKCVKCKHLLTSTGFMFRDQPWHRTCFTCTQCQKVLDANNEIFCKEDRPYCSSCYDELYLDKCAACFKSLRGEIVEYQSKQYHEECFCCDHCKTPIGSTSFFPRENTVYCQTCFCINFGKMCKKCGLTISPENNMGIVYLEEHWHRDCFTCTHCDKSLVGVPIHSTKDTNAPYCGQCYDELFSKRCTACSKVISGVIGSKYITYDDRHWHTDCFNCKMCQTSLANRKFCPSGKDVLCGPCVKYAKVLSQ